MPMYLLLNEDFRHSQTGNICTNFYIFLWLSACEYKLKVLERPKVIDIFTGLSSRPNGPNRLVTGDIIVL